MDSKQCKVSMICLREWSQSGGSYGNNTWAICCPAQGCNESCTLSMSPQDKKTQWCCCCNSLPTMINPDYNMKNKTCIKCIYGKIHSKSPPNRATSHTCLHWRYEPQVLSKITMNHVDTCTKTAVGTCFPLWCTRLLDSGTCSFTHPTIRGNHYSFAPKVI